MNNFQNLAFLSGLPRSGSTVLSNILAMHPDIESTPSSPLCNIVQSMRKTWSQDQFFKAQLDNNLEEMLGKAKRTTMAVMKTWSYSENKKITIDKSRGWIHCIEWLQDIMPKFKMIVTIRDLRSVYASIEKQHRKTLLIEFPDGMEHNLVDVRANALFADNGVVGSPLKAIYNIGDVPDITKNIMIWRYEDFLADPQETINKTFNFLGVESFKIDWDNIKQSTYESDSHYNMKYPHSIASKLSPPPSFNDVKISPRISKIIVDRFSWFYSSYYSDIKDIESSVASHKIEISKNNEETDTEILIKQLDKAIIKEAKLG